MAPGDRRTDGEAGTERWRFETGGAIKTSPTVVDGTVYVGSDDGTLYAVDATSGAEEWRHDTGGLYPHPAIGVGTVYTVGASRDLEAVDATDGTEQWRFETAGQVASGPRVADGTVYVWTDDGHLHAVDAADGTEQWRSEIATLASPRRFVLTVADGTAYVCYRHMYAVDADDGTEQWQLESGYELRTAPTVADGTVYVGGDHLYAVDAGDGTEQWRFEPQLSLGGSLAVVDGTVYVTSVGTLTAVDAENGTEQWSFSGAMQWISGSKIGSPAVVDGTVYVGTNDDHLYAVDAVDGEEGWRFETGDSVLASPAVVDGTVYAGSRGGQLYAVDADDGTERWNFEAGGEVRSPTVVDGTVYIASEESNLLRSDEGTLYAVAAERVGGPATDRSSEGGRAGGHRSFDERVEDIRERFTGDSPSTPGSAVEDPETGPPMADSSAAQVPTADAVASPPRREGLSHGDLTIIEEVGAGGQAVITKARLAEDKQPPEVIALREPDTSTTLTRAAVAAFLKRAETWVTVDDHEREKQRWADHEHVVGVIATGDRQPWIAMEYMDGGDLGDLLAKHPDGLPVAQALWYGECVCRGLEIAHNLGRVHLDVKPGNVLLKETEGWPWPKLADWGLARTLAEETGTVEGLSLQYAAPEQFDSGEFGDPDQLTDIYQTGALVYALLTGEPPATGSQFEVLQRVMSDDPIAPPSERRPDLPPAVDAAVGLALEREKTERYDAIGNFGAALRAIRTGERLPRALAARLDE